MSTHNVCGCNSEDCRVNGCLMKRQRNEAGGFYAADSADCGCSTRSGGSMTTKNTGGHAFPTQAWDYDVARARQYQEPGMSLRDWFAGLAMQGILAAQIYGFNDRPANGPFASMAYEMADAMLKARDET